MKQVDKLIVSSFLKSFFAILFITVFTLLVQIFYAQMQTIMGKNLGLTVYLRLLYYMGMVSVPLATPIAVLIAIVLNFASLSENFELIALKNLGVSFSRILRPLLLIIGILSGGLLFMTNYYIPSSYKNMKNMLFNLEQVNPLNSFREGFFFEDIPGYSIYVGAKDKKKEIFKDVIVYNNNAENFYTITGESAKLYNSKDKKSIIFQIDKGNTYIETPPTKIKNKDNTVNDFMRMSFSVQKIFIDSYNFSFSNNFTESSSRLNSTKTFSIIKNFFQGKKKYDKQKEVVLTKLYDYYGLQNEKKKLDEEPKEKENETEIKKAEIVNETEIVKEPVDSLLKKIQNYEVESINSEIAKNKKDLQQQLRKDLRLLATYKKDFHVYLFEILQRILVCVACFIMVILGACLGSLLKKGELGFAMGLAAFFVAVYNVGVVLFEKMFRADIINLLWGSMGSLLILIPFVIFFYIHAKNDSQIFKGEFRISTFKKRKKKVVAE
ncbi:MAG: LptF/LptG family permease [Cytophagales bacterium]|jgi:lipopolysaccharide export system permease protein|nr:LptF/LptG family permease [Cytophagales bacterium]